VIVVDQTYNFDIFLFHPFLLVSLMNKINILWKHCKLETISLQILLKIKLKNVSH